MPEPLPPCPECGSEFTYELGGMYVCPMDGHEWSAEPQADGEAAADPVIRDAVGNPLEEGDAVTVVKDLRVKGAGSSVIKSGTKVKGIRLLTEDDVVDGHDIEANVTGFGRVYIKSEKVKKAR